MRLVGLWGPPPPNRPTDRPHSIHITPLSKSKPRFRLICLNPRKLPQQGWMCRRAFHMAATPTRRKGLCPAVSWVPWISSPPPRDYPHPLPGPCAVLMGTVTQLPQPAAPPPPPRARNLCFKILQNFAMILFANIHSCHSFYDFHNTRFAKSFFCVT